MGTQERDRKVYQPLRRAGLEVIPDAVPDGTMPFVAGYRAEDVAGGFSHRYDTPRLVERLSMETGTTSPSPRVPGTPPAGPDTSATLGLTPGALCRVPVLAEPLAGHLHGEI
ncbi:hypothetical protein [Streptomyces aureus]|uniref:hypothetical protein n=1 Tax=Streptomyces aureus TaxID=193461 RepID=UPI0031D9CA0F